MRWGARAERGAHLTADQQAAMKDAHQRCTQLPGYCGSIVVIVTRGGQDVAVGTTVPDALVRGVLKSLLLQLEPPAIYVGDGRYHPGGRI